MLHLYESLFRAGYGEHPERFLSKDELDDYRASLSYYNSQYLELLAMLNTEQSVLFKKLQDNRSDIIGLERDASFRCGLCVGLKLGNYYCPTLIVAPITSKAGKKPSQPTHYYAERIRGLELPGMVLLEQIKTIDKRRVRKYLGRMTRQQRA